MCRQVIYLNSVQSALPCFVITTEQTNILLSVPGVVGDAVDGNCVVIGAGVVVAIGVFSSLHRLVLQQILLQDWMA